VDLTACSLSLLLQLVAPYHLVRIDDLSAIMDTATASVVGASVLLVGTIFVNLKKS